MCGSNDPIDEGDFCEPTACMGETARCYSGECVPAEERPCVDGDICMDVMLASEKSSLDQEGDRQLKYYAPGVGRVQVGSVADPENETLALVELSDIRGTLEWTRVLYKTAELLENACNGGFTTLCP